jgi:hypothetical protein
VSLLASVKARYAPVADPLRSERRVELVVVVLLVLLLLQLLWAGGRLLLARDIAPVAPAPDSLRVAELPTPAVVSAEDSAAVQSRPLFWAERRPVEGSLAIVEAEAEAAAKEKAAPKMKDVALLGIFGSGGSGGAIVAVKGKQRRVTVGEAVEGWRLQSVAANEAVFVSGGQRDARELLPRVIAPQVDAAGDIIPPGAGQGGAAAGEADEEPQLSLGGPARR